MTNSPGILTRFADPPAGANDDYNLAESTVRSLRFAELLALARDEPGFGDMALDYGDPAGAPALRQEVATACGVAPDSVVTFHGTMLGLFLLASVACEAGDDAVLVTPCYGPSRDALERARLPIRTARLRFEDGYRLDPDRVAAALRPSTRLVCLADPQNPSGVRVAPEAIAALLAAMARRAPRALLFLDETYREATHGGPAPASAAALDPRIVTAGSLSKAHGAPGLRMAWLTVTDPVLRARLVAARHALVISGSVLDEALAALLLRRAAPVLAARRRALAGALGRVLRWRARVAEQVEMVQPDAGALCCLRLPPLLVGRAGIARFWAAVPQERLRLAPGPWFGEDRRVFRLGFGHLPPAELEEALPALSRALDAAA